MKKLSYILFALSAVLLCVALYVEKTSIILGTHTLYYIFLGIVFAAVAATILRIVPMRSKKRQ